MEISDDYLAACYRDIEALDMKGALIVFGEELSVREGAMSAAPLPPQHYHARAEYWLKNNIEDVCKKVHADPRLRVFILPATHDNVFAGLIEIGKFFEHHIGVAASADPLSMVGVGYASALACKWGFKLLCEIYGGC